MGRGLGLHAQESKLGVSIPFYILPMDSALPTALTSLL